MNSNAQTGLPQLLILIVILAGVFIFNSGVRELGSMNVGNFAETYAKIAKQSAASKKEAYGNLNQIQFGAAGMNRIDDSLSAYLNENGYKQRTEPGKKMVIYTNVYDLVCPYQEQMLKDINAYKSSPDWTQKYTFVEYRTSKSQTMQFNSQEDLEKFKAFNNTCAIFCVVDFDKMTVFRGMKKGDSKYLYNALAAFYR